VKQYKLQQIDEALISQHSCLNNKDEYYFLGEYAGCKGFLHSEMNVLIQNFKKPMDRKNKDEWWYKENAITQIAKLITNAKNWNNIDQYTWVPIPSSKTKSDPMYDDRLIQVLNRINVISGSGSLDIRDIVVPSNSWESAHVNKNPRPSVEDHLSNWKINENLLLPNPNPNTIIIFDDVITMGASFKAAQTLLNIKFPGIPIIGLFVARAIFMPT
jgi:hypothetical protein